MDGGTHLQQQVSPDHLQEIQTGNSGHWLKIWAHVSTELKNIQILIYRHGGRRISAKNDAVRLLLKVKMAPIRFTRHSYRLAEVLSLCALVARGEINGCAEEGILPGVDLVLSVDERKQVCEGADCF